MQQEKIPKQKTISGMDLLQEVEQVLEARLQGVGQFKQLLSQLENLKEKVRQQKLQVTLSLLRTNLKRA